MSTSNVEAVNTNLVGAGPHVILCTRAFPKCACLAQIARDSELAAVYVDADMLYSGYARAGMMSIPPHVLVRRPEPNSWNAELAAIIRATSSEPHLIIVDTLNGLAGMWGGPGGIRRAGHSIMLLAAMGRDAGTVVVAAAMARKSATGWEMSPGGRLIPGAGRLYTLEKDGIVPLAEHQVGGSGRTPRPYRYA